MRESVITWKRFVLTYRTVVTVAIPPWLPMEVLQMHRISQGVFPILQEGHSERFHNTLLVNSGILKLPLLEYLLHHLLLLHLVLHLQAQITLLRLPRRKITPETDSGDYVMTEVPDLRSVQDAIAETQAQTTSELLVYIYIEDLVFTMLRNSVVMADGDGYTMMEVGPSIGTVVSAPASPHGGSTRIASPCTRPDRSASSPVKDNGDMALVPPTGLPKRSSVPTLKSHEARDDSGLNYACLQVQCGELKTASMMGESLLPVGSGRTRSKSGILYSRQNESSKVPLDYAAIKPL
uniref:Uncharacterized protein n=1 Tax=Heterorhabditis bacteriophora TaxID=37862 RepID=A0A1I7WPU4_HETBA